MRNRYHQKKQKIPRYFSTCDHYSAGKKWICSKRGLTSSSSSGVNQKLPGVHLYNIQSFLGLPVYIPNAQFYTKVHIRNW